MIETLILLPFAVRCNLFVTRFIVPIATFHCANHVSYIRTRTHEKYASCTLDLLWVTLQPACWVSVWELSLTCELPYANTRVIIVRLPVSTDWLTDAFTRGGHLWDTLQPACWWTRLHAESPFETQITRLVDAEYPVELKPRYSLASLLRTKGELDESGNFNHVSMSAVG